MWEMEKSYEWKEGYKMEINYEIENILPEGSCSQNMISRSVNTVIVTGILRYILRTAQQ